MGLEVQNYPDGLHFGQRELSAYQKGVGAVKIPGQSAVYGDISLMTILDELTAPSIFIGGPESGVKRNVEGRWGTAPKVGDLFCIGGATTGQSCNWKIQDISDRYRNSAGGLYTSVTRGYRYNRCADRGDSGGPVFTIRPETGNVVAKGVISGGSIDLATKRPPTNDCLIWFTDIRNVVKAFGGDITKRN
ncbi:hypothetical protein ACQP25_03270 [Microtetraspora malaysiensis]|uniref:hypothetical protein n=1 Tax=Microtetraspora malaysiensis TaxID=161358 RepID=UPI003D8BD1E3